MHRGFICLTQFFNFFKIAIKKASNIAKKYGYVEITEYLEEKLREKLKQNWKNKYNY